MIKDDDIGQCENGKRKSVEWQISNDAHGLCAEKERNRNVAKDTKQRETNENNCRACQIYHFQNMRRILFEPHIATNESDHERARH